jgi:hypothetical protein
MPNCWRWILFFTLHNFSEVGKTQDLLSKFWQTLGDALTSGIPRETKLCMCPSTSWKTYIRNHFLFFISFSPSHLEGNNDDNHDLRAHICAWGGEFCQVSILPSWFAKLLEANFSCFAKIIWMPSWFAKLLELLLQLGIKQTSNSTRNRGNPVRPPSGGG